jgi:hypothetical protein
VNALDFRIGDPVAVAPHDDAPVQQTLHMRREAALKLSDKLREWAFATPDGGWIEVNVIGYRLIPAALEGMIIRGRAL